MDFQLDAFFNPHLQEGASSVTAVLAVAGRGSGESGPVPTGRRAFGIVIDASPSMMDNGGERMKAARAAARACVAALDPSDMFTIVTFASGARTVVGSLKSSKS